MSNSTTLQTARSNARQDVTMGFGNLESFELMQRAAKLLASSTLVPVAYRAEIHKTDRYGNITDTRQNPNALANAVVALNMAQRMGADPLMVMQNLYIVEGRPSWSSQWIIAAINGCGRFSPLRFDIKKLGNKKIAYTQFVWENGQRKEVTKTVEVEDIVCVAWAVEKETGERIESPSVSIEMAVKEGWYTKNGSKWQTMPEVMLRYRTASFFGKLYAPELLMGLQTVEEAHDIIDATPTDDGTIQVDVESLRADRSENAKSTKAEQADATDAEFKANTASVDPDTGEVVAEAETVDAAYLDTDKVLASIQRAQDHDTLSIAADSIQDCDPDDRDDLGAAYRKRLDELDDPRQAAAGDTTSRPTRTRRAAAADME